MADGRATVTIVAGDARSLSNAIGRLYLALLKAEQGDLQGFVDRIGPECQGEGYRVETSVEWRAE